MKFITGLLLFGSNGIVASGINLPSYDIVVLRTLLGMRRRSRKTPLAVEHAQA